MTAGRVGVLWLRVSDDKGQDIAGQERDLRAAAARLGVVVPDEFVFRMADESAHSVFKGDPPEKKQVLALARRRKFDVLLVWSLDRWSRRRRDGLREIFDTLEPCGVRMFSHEEPFLNTDGLPDFVRENLASTLLWLAEEDSKRKSRRVRLKYETNRNRAASLGARAKWGRGVVASEDDRQRVVAAAGRGLSERAVSRETNVPRSTVRRILMDQSSPELGARVEAQKVERSNGTIGPGGEAQ